MNRYGQSITWSTTTAPAPATGICTSWLYRPELQRDLDDDMAGDFRAALLYGKKAAVEFEANVTQGSTNFLNLALGAKLAVSGVSGGTLLARRAVERWALNQKKTISLSGTHYDFTGGSGANAGTTLSAVTPDQTGLEVVQPGGKLIYSTYGLEHDEGVVHGLTITQELTITEDDLAPDGTIPGATTHGYMRSIELLLLATGSLPLVGSDLSITGAPSHAADYKITSAEERFAHKRGKMFSIQAFWISPFTS